MRKAKEITVRQVAVYKAFREIFLKEAASQAGFTSVRSLIKEHKDKNNHIRSLVEKHGAKETAKLAALLRQKRVFDPTSSAHKRMLATEERISKRQEVGKDAQEATPDEELEQKLEEELEEILKEPHDEDYGKYPEEKPEGESKEEAAEELEKKLKEDMSKDETSKEEPKGEEAIKDEVKEEPNQPSLEAPKELPKEASPTEKPKEEPKKPAKLNVPKHTLLPIILDYPTQYRLSNRLLNIMEEACFRYGQREMPKLLKEKRWDCVESVELLEWLMMFSSGPILATKPKFKNKLLDSLRKFRNRCIHRVRIDIVEFQQSLKDGEKFLDVLGELTPEAKKVLDAMRQEAAAAYPQMYRSKQILESKLNMFLEGLAEQRAELDRLEKEAIAKTFEKDRQNQLVASRELEEAIKTSESRRDQEQTEEAEEPTPSEEDQPVQNKGGCRMM